jgi:Zn-finger protein
MKQHLLYPSFKARVGVLYHIKMEGPIIWYFQNSLIIHEENTKKNHKLVVSLYVIEIPFDLHKL